MIIGIYCLDPKHIVSSSYELHSKVGGNLIYIFGIQYLLGNNLDSKTQFCTEEECIKWTKQLNKYVGKSELVEAIASKMVSEEEEEDEDDDDDLMSQKRTIGFKG